MKRTLLTLTLVTGLASISAMCNNRPSPVNPVNPIDAGPVPIIDGDSYDQACASIQSIGCSEGTNPNCAVTMRGAESNRLEFYDAECLKTAKSKDAVRACGNGKVKCL